jgi:hypothetical protein
VRVARSVRAEETEDEETLGAVGTLGWLGWVVRAREERRGDIAGGRRRGQCRKNGCEGGEGSAMAQAGVLSQRGAAEVRRGRDKSSSSSTARQQAGGTTGRE